MEIKLKELKERFAKQFPDAEYWRDGGHYVAAFNGEGSKCYDYWSCSTLRDFFARVLDLSKEEVDLV